MANMTMKIAVLSNKGLKTEMPVFIPQKEEFMRFLFSRCCKALYMLTTVAHCGCANA